MSDPRHPPDRTSPASPARTSADPERPVAARRPAHDPSREAVPRVPGAAPERGRGATFNPANRFRRETREAVDDGWLPACSDEGAGDDLPARRKTTVTIHPSRTILTRNDSPDVGFNQSVNPYQGCEHGCIYCFARPSHAYHDLSPGIDFETRLFAKADAPELLRTALAKPGYRCETIALGINTDGYQPIEREWKITRRCLEVLHACDHPVTIVTKSALIERDLDLLAPMAAKGLAKVFVTITTLDREIARRLEPRAAAPQRRLETLRALSDAGVPAGVMVAPVIPQLTDKDLEAILEAASAHGAREAGYVILRLPHEVAPLFRDWLDAHYPLRAAHVMSIVRDMRGGRDYDASFATRMRGSGAYASLLENRFRIACRRYGYQDRDRNLVTGLFHPPAMPDNGAPAPEPRQRDLFG
ncbi:MAG: PA0069 family radical SAM protein [Casimicrobiaceae bacterium]